MNRPSPESSAEALAALWAARLDGSTLSSDDRRQLNRWLAEDAEHRRLLSAYCQLGADLEKLLPRLGAQLDLPPASTRNAEPRTARWPRFVAVGLAAAAALAALVTVLPSGSEATRVASRIGERAALALDDGSRVELNAQTAVVVELTATARRVRLASGQAFFDVRRDPSRPFIVETPQGSVRVTGTQFDVRAEGAGPLEVTVAEGSVQVSSHEAGGASGDPVTLRAGQRYTGGARAAVRDLSPAALADALAWRDGQIVFDGVPLREALARFARYHGRSLTASADAGELPVGGRYSLDDLEGFLAALEEIFPVEVSQNLTGTVHVRSRSGR